MPDGSKGTGSAVAVKSTSGKSVLGPKGSRKPQVRYNKERHETIVQKIREGKTKSMAFTLAGFSPDSVYEMLANGRKDPEKYPHFIQLDEDIRRAEAEFLEAQVDKVVGVAQSTAPNTWQAAAWLLERKDKANWGRQDKVKIENEGAPLIQLNQVVLVDEDAREISRDLLRRITGASPHLALGPGVGSESEEVIDAG